MTDKRSKRDRKIQEGGVAIRIVDVEGQNISTEIEDEFGNIWAVMMNPGSMISLNPPS